MTQQEAIFDTLVNSSDEGYCVIDMIFDAVGRASDYVFLASNKAFEKHTGFAAPIGSTIRELAPNTDRHWLEAFGDVAKTGRAIRLIQQAQQNTRWFEVYAFRLGQAGHRVAMHFRDVTAQVEAEKARERLDQEVQAERARLKEIFAQAPSFISVHEGADHVTTMANERFLTLVGHRNIVGKPVIDALPEIVGQGAMKMLDQVYRTGESVVGKELRIRLARGPRQEIEDRYTDFVFQALRNANGDVTGVLLQGVDVTERLLAERALKEADRRKDEFLALLAHELRNPLAAVANSVALLGWQERNAAPIKPTGETGAMVVPASPGTIIRRQIQHMVRLVEDLLDVSRINTGKIELRRERTDLRALVQQAVETTAPFLTPRRVEMSISLPEAPVYLNADPARITQVVGNLLHNAAKFTQEGGHVWLSVSVKGEWIELSVRDDGIGIAAEDLGRVFELFSQLEAPLDRSQRGLGIGLSLVRSLVGMHGGIVEGRSEGTGKGTQFTIRLPVAAAP